MAITVPCETEAGEQVVETFPAAAEAADKPLGRVDGSASRRRSVPCTARRYRLRRSRLFGRERNPPARRPGARLPVGVIDGVNGAGKRTVTRTASAGLRKNDRVVIPARPKPDSGSRSREGSSQEATGMAAEELKLNDRLAVDRTAMAAQRTLLAWVRTSLSLISFGFTIYKVLQQFQTQGLVRVARASGPRNVGLFLIFLGASSLTMGTLNHWYTMRGLGRTPKQILRDSGVALAVVIILAGAFLFISILVRMEVV